MAGKHKIGILALQGDVSLHQQALAGLGVHAVKVRMPDHLKGLDGVIIPGGESTALLRLAKPIGMLDAIKDFAKAGGRIFGTCAGAILLAKNVVNPQQESLDLIDITIERNGYGRQLESTEGVAKMHSPLGAGPLPITLIRAPRISGIGTKVEALVTYKSDPVLAKQENILIATFHPELTDDLSIYEYWISGFSNGSGRP